MPPLLRPRVSLCRDCLRFRPQPRYITTRTAQTPFVQPPSSALAPIRTRELISVSGANSAKFLQGLTTGNLVGADGSLRKDPFFAALLVPNGRLLLDIFIYPTNTGGEPEYLVEGHGKHADRLLAWLKRYSLKSAVKLRRLEEGEMMVWQAWDSTGAAFGAAKMEAVKSQGGIIFEDPRVPGLGHRIVQKGDQPPPLDLETTGEDNYIIRRYLNGVAEGADEIPMMDSLPMEFNLEFMNAVDFHKGCYVGQELTVRTKHRGVVRKRVLPCLLYGPGEAPPTELHYGPAPRGDVGAEPDVTDVTGRAPIFRSPKTNKREVGRWLTGIPGSNLGLAICRLESMTDIKLIGEGQWNPEDEFKVHWGAKEEDNPSKSETKVKPFVPEWLRRHLEQAKPRVS